MSPNPVKALCTLTITGSNFGSTQGTVKIWNMTHITPKVATVQSWSNTQIKVTVPKFGTTYPLTGKKKDVQVIVSGGQKSNYSLIKIVAPGTCP
jgi:hypothetical protein